MDNPSGQTRKVIVLLSPIGIIGVGFAAARLLSGPMGVWVWVPMVLLTWAMFAFMITWAGGRQAVKRWFQPRQGGWGWPLLAVAVGLTPIYLFLLNWRLFSSTWMIVAWILFALINPMLEEGYWRGLLIDNTERWPAWLAVLYSAFFFATNHPLTIGVFSIANRHPFVIISTFIMGVAWAAVYRKTRSLRWTIFAHLLTDLFNLSILAFQNIYVPPSMPWQ